jgi:hypothetical protein
LTAAGSAGDPWSTALPGAYGAGTAGLLLGTTIPNAITTIDNEIAVIDGIVDDILVDTGTTLNNLIADIPTNAELASAFTEIKGATWSAATDTLEHIRDKETDIETDTQDLQTQVGVDGAGLTALPWNAAWDAEVQSECTDALNAYDPPTKAELDTAQGAVTVASIANGAITAAAIATDAIDADALAATGLSEIADAVWDEAIADHVGAGSTGKAATDILADTNELQTDDTPAALAAVKTVVDLIEDIIRNKMEITDANGNLVLYEDDNSTPKYSVNACVVDNSTTTTRKRLE